MFLLREMKSRRQVLEDDCNSNATEEGKDDNRLGNLFLAICYMLFEKKSHCIVYPDGADVLTVQR